MKEDLQKRVQCARNPHLVFSNSNDTKTILDQSRKLDVQLQDVWNGCVALSEDETLTLQYFIRKRIMRLLISASRTWTRLFAK